MSPLRFLASTTCSMNITIWAFHVLGNTPNAAGYAPGKCALVQSAFSLRLADCPCLSRFHANPASVLSLFSVGGRLGSACKHGSLHRVDVWNASDNQCAAGSNLKTKHFPIWPICSGEPFMLARMKFWISELTTGTFHMW